MTIDEAIQRYVDNAEYERTHENLQGCLEFKQLVKWLKELKQIQEQEPYEDCVSRRAVIEYIKASDAELGHSSEKEIVVEDIKCIATVKFSKEEVKWLKELRAYRKMYHKELKQMQEQKSCDDAISRRAVLRTLDNMDSVLDENRTVETYKELLTACYKDLPSVTPAHKQKWIPVSEELPKESVYKEFVEPSESVLVQLNNGEMKVSRYWGSRESYKDKPWIDLSYPTTLEVIAWMPLPKPYKEAMESEE